MKRAQDLARLVNDNSTTDGERMAAARALARLTLDGSVETSEVEQLRRRILELMRELHDERQRNRPRPLSEQALRDFAEAARASTPRPSKQCMSCGRTFVPDHSAVCCNGCVRKHGGRW